MCCRSDAVGVRVGSRARDIVSPEPFPKCVSLRWVHRNFVADCWYDPVGGDGLPYTIPISAGTYNPEDGSVINYMIGRTEWTRYIDDATSFLSR